MGRRQQLDVLIVADAMAANLMVDGITVLGVHTQEGFREIGEDIIHNRINVKGFKIVVLLCGRCDLWETEKMFREGLAFCLNAIRDKNTKAIIVLTATLPSPSDSKVVIRVANYRNGYLSQLAGEAPRLEFSRLGKFLTQTGGCVLEYFDEFNNLNNEGLDVVCRGLDAKFRCARLRARFEELRNQNDV